MHFPWFQQEKKEPRQVGQTLLQIMVDELRRRKAKIEALEAEIERLRSNGTNS